MSDTEKLKRELQACDPRDAFIRRITTSQPVHGGR